MTKDNDQVFQLSLTEIAFTLVFIILLLLGAMVFKAETDKKVLEAQIATAAETKSALDALNEAKQSLLATLSSTGAAKPDEIISELTSPKNWMQERDKLKARIVDLDKQISALTELKNAITNASEREKDRVIKEQIESALSLQSALTKRLEKPSKDQKAVPLQKHSTDIAKEALAAIDFKAEVQQQLKEQLGTAVETGREPQIAKELVGAFRQVVEAKKTASSPEAIKKDNSDLRGQVAFLKGKLDARGGRDYPPCWAEENTGKIQFLFTIEIHSDGLLITPAWPSSREPEGRAFIGVDRLLISKPHSLAEFNTEMQGIDAGSKVKNCRHYVYIKNRVNQLDVFNRYRYGIENFFYKLELRS